VAGLGSHPSAAKTFGAPLYGKIETREIKLGSKVSGRVLMVHVEEGQLVTPGQLLVSFDSAEAQAQQAQAHANVALQRARLTQLLNGALPAEITQAQAATAQAQARWETLRNGARREEIAQAQAALAAAEAELNQAEVTFQRYDQLQQSGDLSRQERDNAQFRRAQLRGRRDAEQQRLTLLESGNRAEDINGAAEWLRQQRAAESLVVTGARPEEIAAARAQLAEAEARLRQCDVWLAETTLRASTQAVVEAVNVRPGDLIQPHQAVVKLLERDQLFVRVYIPEPELGHLRIGQRARLRIDTFPDRSFNGVIEQINAQGEFTPRNVQSRDERNHQVFGVKVRVEHHAGQLKAGMAATVELEETP
jgi:multidrug resistance efflux pump